MIEIAQNKEVLRIDIREIGNQKTSPNKKPSTSTTVRQVQLQKDLREKANSGKILPLKRKRENASTIEEAPEDQEQSELNDAGSI